MARGSILVPVAALAALPAAAAVGLILYLTSHRHPVLSLPIVCEPGRTCFIQSYVDVDPGPGAQDYACGSATYDGHKGTDFRVLSAAAASKGVAVVSAADGTVKATRDGMREAFVSEATRDAVQGRECGNGVVIDHGQGWETQYCHMRRGSIGVRSGQQVARGMKLGEVGYSGMVQFAHLHLEVRRDGKPVDPFTGRLMSEACSSKDGASAGLWSDDAARAFPYQRGTILGAGFIADAAALDNLEVEHQPPRPDRTSPTLLFFVRLANLLPGDRVTLHVEGPEGFIVDSPGEPVERAKATWRGFAGKKLSAAAWPAGVYRGTASLVRDGRTVIETKAEIELK